MEYEWEIKNADQEQNSLIVEYSISGKTICLNLPYPTTEDIEGHVKSFAPNDFLNAQKSTVVVQIGQRGSVKAFGTSEDMPNLNGNWNEEYIRALIYQVMEEIREASV